MSQSPSSRRSADDRGFRLGTGFFASLVVLLVAAIAFELYRTSHLSIDKFGFNFWRTKVWDPVAGQFGALPFIWGTLYSSVLALVISTPIALGIAIFLSELSPRFLRTPLAFLTELLAAIPSIVYGLWGVFVLVPARAQARDPDARVAAPDAALLRAPGRRRNARGRPHPGGHGRFPSPRPSRARCSKAVPPTQREAAYALGATRWEAIQAALRYGRTGVIGAIMLGFGRAIGETMAVTMVIGNNPAGLRVALRARSTRWPP